MTLDHQVLLKHPWTSRVVLRATRPTHAIVTLTMAGAKAAPRGAQEMFPEALPGKAQKEEVVVMGRRRERQVSAARSIAGPSMRIMVLTENDPHRSRCDFKCTIKFIN